MASEETRPLIWQGIWLAALAAMLAALYTIFFYAPTERTMGLVQRIFYFHVPSAGVAFSAFFVVFLASILFLAKKERRWDLLAYSSGEIGLLYCTLVLITGPLWARPVWGTWWTWDPRLTTTLVLWFIYVAYLMLRSAAGGSIKGARLAAVFGIVGFVDVPIVFMSIRWWRTIHPVVFERTRIGLEPPMLVTLFISLVAFLLLFAVLVRERYRLMLLSDEVALLRQMPPAGSLSGRNQG